MKIPILSILLFCVMMGSVGASEEEPLPDLSTVKDPFLPGLKPVVIQKPVEPVVEASNVIPEPVTTNAVVPVAPVPVPRPVLPPMVIQGLIWGADKPGAIINDTVVGVGDTIAGGIVKSIQKDRVHILFQGENFNVLMDQ